ncbi:MAG: hypothetical protein SFY67_10425 [Candidatus Melainabacteria bacterium]|nr:hypothetical protein [Candidatus Melainabacteria bacterium]
MKNKEFSAVPWLTPLNGCFCVEFCRFSFNENLSLVLYVQCRRTQYDWEFFSISSQRIFSFRCLRNLIFFQKQPKFIGFSEPLRLHKWTSILSGSDWENIIDQETFVISKIAHYRIETDTHIFDLMSAQEPDFRKLSKTEVQTLNLKKQEKLDVYHSPEEGEKIAAFHEGLKKKTESI